MRKSAMTVLGLVIAFAPIAANAEEVASLPKPGSNYLVFLRADGSLPPLAKDMIRTAAANLKHERSVKLEGRPAYVEKVKHELIRNGVSPRIIVDQSMDVGLAVSQGDGIDTAARAVEIKR